MTRAHPGGREAIEASKQHVTYRRPFVSARSQPQDLWLDLHCCVFVGTPGFNYVENAELKLDMIYVEFTSTPVHKQTHTTHTHTHTHTRVVV